MYLAISDIKINYFDFECLKRSDDIIVIENKSGINDDNIDANMSYAICGNHLLMFSVPPGTAQVRKKGERLGYIKNTGMLPLFLSFPWRRWVVLPVGEEIEVRYSETGSEEALPDDERYFYLCKWMLDYLDH